MVMHIKHYALCDGGVYLGEIINTVFAGWVSVYVQNLTLLASCPSSAWKLENTAKRYSYLQVYKLPTTISIIKKKSFGS